MSLIALPARRSGSPLSRPVRRLNPALGYPIFYGVPGHWYGGWSFSDNRVVEYPGIVRTAADGRLGAQFNTGSDSISESTAPVIVTSAAVKVLAHTGAMSIIVDATPNVTPANRANRGLFARWRGMASGAAVNYRSWALYYDMQTHASQNYLRFAVSSTGSSTTAVTAAGADVPIGTRMRIVATFDPSRRIALYLNGTLYGESTTSVPSALFSTADLVGLWVGAQYEVDGATSSRGTYTFPGTISWVSLHEGVIGDELAKSITSDDLQRAVVPRRRVWVPVSAATGLPTLSSITASNITTTGARLTVAA